MVMGMQLSEMGSSIEGRLSLEEMGKKRWGRRMECSLKKCLKRWSVV